MSPHRVSPWPLAPMVFMALAGALGGAVLLAIIGAALGALANSWLAVGILAIGFAVLGALGGFATVLLALLRGRLVESERRILSQLAASTVPEQAPVSTADSRPSPRPLSMPPAAARTSPADRPIAPPVPTPAPTPAPEAAGLVPSGAGSRGEGAPGRLLRRARAWLKAGNTIARVGIVVLFIGAALLAKYAAENGLFPLEVRLMVVALVGMGLLGLGWRLRQGRTGYALTLQGGGVAVLYLTFYASLRLYQLIPSGLAFTLMVIVALAAAVLAVLQNSLVLAVIGFTGGFVAPILTSSGDGSHIALFSYYTVLNLGVFAVAWFRAWRVLNLVGFAFTFLVSALWRGMGYTEADLVSTDAFLLLFFLLYVAVSLLFAWRQPPGRMGYVSGTLVFGLPVVAFALHGSLVAHIEYALAWSALVLALFYLLLATVLFYLRRADWRLLAEAFAALGVIFGSLAVPLAFGGEATAAMWAVEGAGLLWLGVRQRRRLARAFGALLQLAASVELIWALASDGGGAALPIINGVFMAGLGLTVAGYLSGLWLYRLGSAAAAHERGAHWLFLAWAVLWAVVTGLVEVSEFAPVGLGVGLTLVVLACILALLDLLGRGLSWRASFQVAPLLAALVLFWGSLLLLLLSHPLAQGAWFGWPILWLVFYGLLYRRDQDAEVLLPVLTGWLHALGLWMLALVAIHEVYWRVASAVAGVWPWLVWALVPALLMALCARAPALWPLSRHGDAYRLQGALPLAMVAALWLALANLGSNGDPGPLPYWPLLNPLDITVMLTLLATIVWWLALSVRVRGALRVAPAVLAALVFLWLSAALVRALHYSLGTPLDAGGMIRSVTVQMALSLFWALLGFAIMVTATRRAWRVVWLVGAGLMGVVVVKLFLVDLAGTETLARTVSFLGVGLVLLVIGYFSPLPPRGKESR